jgi:hypothetical protein
MLRFLRASSLAVLLAAFDAACTRRHVAAPVAAPVPPTPTAAPAETAPSPAPVAPAPPPQTQPPQPQAPQPQAPQPQPPQPQPPSQSPQPSTAPRRSTPPSEPNPPPRLGDILTPEQARQYNSAIDQSLARTQSSLGVIAQHRLTKEQQGVVAQIQSFIQQAQTTRKSNLPAARSLAERADVLARDLAGSLR